MRGDQDDSTMSQRLRAGNVLARNGRAQCGRPSTLSRRRCGISVTVQLLVWPRGETLYLRNGRNSCFNSRLLFRMRELTEFCGKLSEFGEELDEFTFTQK